MGRVLGFYASNNLRSSLERIAGEEGKSLSKVIREILYSKLSGREFIIVPRKEDEWIVGKFLLEELPKLLRDYKEKITGRSEDVRVRIAVKV